MDAVAAQELSKIFLGREDLARLAELELRWGNRAVFLIRGVRWRGDRVARLAVEPDERWRVDARGVAKGGEGGILLTR